MNFDFTRAVHNEIGLVVSRLYFPKGEGGGGELEQ